jgi:glycosyltransferase involved in cell wall biosynthesis
MQQAAVVFCSTRVTIDRIRKLGLVDAARLIYAPYGIAPEFTTDPPVEAGLQRATDMTGKLETCRHRLESPFLLHVGSCISRKRMDVLLEVFATVRRRWPELDLVQVGGQWTAAQQRQIEQLRLGQAIRQLRGLDRKSLAVLYRRAALVLLPSEGEGFGLPVIEALACGAVVVASDIPVLREVGGDGAVYCPVANVSSWVDTINRLLASPDFAPDRCTRISQAGRLSWEKHAAIILEAYQKLASGVA